MLRVRESSLTRDDEGRFSRGGQPFSGLVYQVTEDASVRGLEVVLEGSITGPSGDWLDLPAGGSRVDSSVLEVIEDWGPKCLRGVPFTGVAYRFDGDGACLSEDTYAAGAPTDQARRWWYPSGAPQLALQGAEATRWFEDGRLQLREEGDVTLLDLVPSDDGRLAVITLADASLLDRSNVQRMGLADEVTLMGAAVDAGLLASLRDQAGLGAVSALHLTETGLGPDGVEVLVSLRGLRQLWLKRNAALSAEHAEQIRARRPDCAVDYEGSPEVGAGE